MIGLEASPAEAGGPFNVAGSSLRQRPRLLTALDMAASMQQQSDPNEPRCDLQAPLSDRRARGKSLLSSHRPCSAMFGGGGGMGLRRAEGSGGWVSSGRRWRAWGGEWADAAETSLRATTAPGGARSVATREYRSRRLCGCATDRTEGLGACGQERAGRVARDKGKRGCYSLAE